MQTLLQVTGVYVLSLEWLLMRMGRIQSLGLVPRPCLSSIYSAKDMFNSLVSMLPKFALYTADYFIASLLEMLFTHKLALLLVIR